MSQAAALSPVVAVRSRKRAWLADLKRLVFSVEVFMAFFVAHVVVKAIYLQYIAAMLTTMERRFGLSSSHYAYVISAFDLGNTVTCIVGSYVGGRGHLPRFIAGASCIFGCASLLWLVPYFFYERPPLLSDTDLIHDDLVANATFALDLQGLQQKLCRSPNASAFDMRCSHAGTPQSGVDQSNSFVVFVLANALAGAFGAVSTPLGCTYLDNNLPSHKSALYMGVVISMYSLGGMGGLLLGSYSSTIYEYPSAQPSFTESDARWIGAWWLGYLLVGISEVCLALPIALYPRSFRPPPGPDLSREFVTDFTELKPLTASDRSPSDAQSTPTPDDSCLPKDSLEPPALANPRQSLVSLKQPTPLTPRVGCARFVKDFFVMLLQLMRNVIFVSLVVSLSLSAYSVAGLGYFFPKYLEVHFQLDTASANWYTGLCLGLTGATFMILGGILSSWLRFGPTHNALFCVCCILLPFIVYVPAAFLGCQQERFLGLNNAPLTNHSAGTVNAWLADVDAAQLNSWRRCSDACRCNYDDTTSASGYFGALCDQNTGISYATGCSAGCKPLPGKSGYDLKCGCLLANGSNGTELMKAGVCSEDCGTSLWMFLVLNTVAAAIASLGQGPGFSLCFRVVEPEQKSVAIGAIWVLTSVFGWIPAPILLGKVVDSACVHWLVECGRRASCAAYDKRDLRIKLHAVCAASIFGSLLFFVLVLYKVFRRFGWTRELADAIHHRS